MKRFFIMMLLLVVGLFSAKIAFAHDLKDCTWECVKTKDVCVHYNRFWQCDKWDKICEKYEKVCVTPIPEVTPTPEITPTPEVTPVPVQCTEHCGTPPTFAASSTEPPVCNDGNTTKVPANAHVIRSGSKAIVNAFITEGNSANIYWRVVGVSEWQNAMGDVKPNADSFVSVTINDLNPVLGYDFGIQQKRGCGGGELITAVIIDGPQSNVFRVNYYQ